MCAEKQRVPQNEVENIKALTVKDLDLHIRANAIAHHTNKFAITDKKKTKNQQAVLRRGQEFKVTVTFNRAYNKDKDDLIFIFDAGKLSIPDAMRTVGLKMSCVVVLSV